MKLCPNCNRFYTDETLNFCLDDGASLVYGSKAPNEPATVVLGTGAAADKAPTRMFSRGEPASNDSIHRASLAGKHIDKTGGVSNIWSLPLDGGPPKQLTDFKTDQIFWFDFSRDGKQLALSRGTVTSDVVLISNFK